MGRLTFLTFTLAVASVVSAKADNGQISVETRGDAPRHVTVTALTENIIRVANTPAGVETPQSQTLLPVKRNAATKSLETAGAEVLTTGGGIVVSVDKADGAVTIAAPGGVVIADNGVRLSSGGKESLSLLTPGNESFYGAGERGYSLNLAADTLVMFNRQNYGYTAGEDRIKQMNITMPLLISSKGYAIVFDDYAAATLTTSNPLTYTTEANKPVSYYFISGVTGDDRQARIDNVVSKLTLLTGRQELPPLWSLGYITSKYGYRTEAETRGVIDSLKRAGYPVDGIVLDLYWYGKEEDMGRLEWDKEQWPNHVKMLSDLKKKGVSLVTISQPYVLRNGRAIDNYNELAPKGMFVRDSLGNPGEVKIWVGEGGMFDVSNPDTRNWLAERYHQLTEMGVTGWWGDLGEPEVHPDSLWHYNGLKARQYHNLYGNDWSKIIYDMFKEQYPDRRLMTMMRGGTVGLQRYNVFPWSTDVSRSWGGLQPQVTIMLNSGLSGLGYMSHDVGGFAVDPNNPVDPELYVRWLQLGTFSPILRTHSTRVAEPYKYPEQQHIIMPLIKERYAWLPYNYTLAFENASEGQPLVRPLNYYNSADTSLDGITDEYLWGRDVLVAPVLTQGATEREITFPDGQWVDMANPSEVYQGGQTISYAAPLEVLPMFARAGALIARASYPMKNVGDYRTDNYTVRYYPVEGKSDGYIFEDDMSTPTTIAEGRYTLLRFEADAADKTVSVRLAAENGSQDYTNPTVVKNITFEVFNIGSRPASVTFNGKKAAFAYNAASRTVTVKVKWNITTVADLVITK
ncbi:hypothetical protein ED352_00815 [Muribaculaceae bacterium Isolate-002 (NCI)]|nr:hypothetical protein ED352_00815 [Muribaculaceae bacterium Isolate-002 (NCI)]